jgi:hypothetical protein
MANTGAPPDACTLPLAEDVLHAPTPALDPAETVPGALGDPELTAAPAVPCWPDERARWHAADPLRALLALLVDAD